MGFKLMHKNIVFVLQVQCEQSIILFVKNEKCDSTPAYLSHPDIS